METQLESVLDAYAAAEPGPSRTTLTEWIRRYPQYARELTEFTARWQLLEWVDDALEADQVVASDVAVDEERLLLRGMSAAQSAFYALRQPQQFQPEEHAGDEQSFAQSGSPVVTTPISSLVAAAKGVGLSFPELSERAGLSEALLRKLDRRLIDPLTIPVQVLVDLAIALQRTTDALAAYVNLGPTLAPRAQHRADQVPTIPKEREDFFHAVRNDLSLPDSRRRELLALPHPEARGGDTPRRNSTP